MLRGLSPLLSPEVLHLIARMGHGDDLAILDGNHPAEAIARATTSGTLIRCPGVAVDAMLSAVLTLLPIDDFTDDPVRFMAPVGGGDTPEAVRGLRQAARAAGYAGDFVDLERFSFYAAARACFGVIHCGDPRFYGNVLVRKGAIPGEKP